MKNVILFIDSLGSGGAQRQVSNIACLLKKENYNVSVLVYRNVLFYKSLLDNAGIPVVVLESKSNISRILKIRKYINASKTDAVIAFLETPCFIACLSKLWRKKWKLITTERNSKMGTFTAKRNRFFNWFERFSDAKIANSKNAIEMWKKFYPEYNDKYSVIYNHIVVPDEYIYKKHTYLSSGKLKMTVAASYQELKNPLGLIEAVNILNETEKSKLEIHWYGQINVSNTNTEIYYKALKKVKEYGLEQVVYLNNETDKIYELMSDSDAVGLFSKVEGLPNAICEAMIIGRPIVMSKVSDYDVLVSDNGFLCDSNSIDSIRQALSKLLSLSPDELEKMGNASKAKANKLFSADTITKQWIEHIEG